MSDTNVSETSIVVHDLGVVKRMQSMSMKAVQKLLPKEQIYFPQLLPHVAPLKYLGPDGSLHYESEGVTAHELKPTNVSALPLESLLQLEFLLKQKQN